MDYHLYKISSPGFKKSFNNLEELTHELSGWMCGECLENGKELNSMLASPCGCEFLMQDPIANPETKLEAMERSLQGDYRLSIGECDNNYM